MGSKQKIGSELRRLPNLPWDREAVEGALERNLLAYKFITLLTPETPFSISRLVIHNFEEPQF